MTEPHAEHADLDALADALAAESDGAPLPEHLQACPTCAAALSELRTAMGAVASDLRALPAVPAVPATLETFAPPTAAAATVLPSTPPTSLDDRRSARRWLAPAGGIAAAAVLVVGGGLLLSSNATDSTKAARSSAGADTLAVSTSGHDYASVRQVQDAVPALLGGPAKTVPEASSTTGSSGGVGAVTTDPLARLRTPTALASCLASLTEPGDTTRPLALDYASYQHRPALLVVLPDTKPSKVVIFVVGPACTQRESDLYLYVRADRPGP